MLPELPPETLPDELPVVDPLDVPDSCWLDMSPLIPEFVLDCEFAPVPLVEELLLFNIGVLVESAGFPL
jgi:hypothetical protein